MKQTVLICLLVLGGCTPSAPPVQGTEPVAVIEVRPRVEKRPLLKKFVQSSNPKLTKDEASRIARLLENVSRAHGIDVFLFAAIIRQESHFKTGARNCSGQGCDGGMGQVNELWIPVLKLNRHRLVHDDEYNLNVSARILRYYMRKWRHEERAYSRYHNGIPSKRAAYEAKVEKYKALARALRT